MSYAIKTLPVLLAVLSLSGCAGMNDDFSCKKVDGIEGCASMTDINNIINDGKISSDTEGHVTKSLDNGKKPQSAITNHVFKRANFVAIQKPDAPYRTKDKIARITILSYKDNHGNYHETHDVYSVVEPSHWMKRGQ